MSDTAEKILIACPNCHKQYRVAANMVGKQAGCRCGTVFAVEPPPPRIVLNEPQADPLADPMAEPPMRSPLDEDAYDSAPPPPVAAGPTDCVNHPGTQAVCACADCHKLLCRSCSFPQHDGRNLCTNCAIMSASPTLGGSKAFSSTVVVGTCAVHRDVEAVVRCRYCNMLLCKTCDFEFGTDFHLCPRCATAAPQGLGRGRKVLLIGSLVALGLTLLGTIAKFALAASLAAQLGPMGQDLLTRLFACLLLTPAIVGFALAYGSFARRAINPPIIWVSLSLNTLMVVFWFGMQLVLMFTSISPPPPPPTA